MKKRAYYTILTMIVSFGLSAQVGIGTTDPQEELHIAGSTANIRVDGLAAVNNNENLGMNSSTRVYVNADGDLVLGGSTETIEILVDAENYLDDVENPTSLINQTGNAFGYDPGGVPTDLVAAQFTLTSNAIVEVNYSVSWSVYKTNSASGRIDDEHARIVQTGVYLRRDDGTLDPLGWPAVVNDVDGIPINGGPWCIDVNAAGTICQETGGLLALNGQFYNNADSKNGAYQDFQNTASDYVKLGPGTYIALFSAQLAVGDTSGTGAVKMYLGSGKDDLQIIAYYYQ